MAGGGVYSDRHVGHQGPPPTASQEHRPTAPHGEVVQVYTEANPNYRLTYRQDGAVLAFKNSRDVFQEWIKVDVGPGYGEFVDREGQPGFVLVNKASGLPLKHGHENNDIVETHRHVFAANSPLQGSILWTLGRKDEGHGFKGIRAVTNIGLNLSAEHADKDHGGVHDGNRLIVSAWKDTTNFKWKIEPVDV